MKKKYFSSTIRIGCLNFPFYYSHLHVGPRSVNHLNVCFNMQQPIMLLMCSKLSKHVNIPSSRDGVAHMVLCFAELVPKTCREAAIRKLGFANKYHSVTMLILINQDKRQRQRHAPRHQGVSETLVTCAPWLSHTYFGLTNQGSELSWKTGPNWMFFQISLYFFWAAGVLD